MKQQHDLFPGNAIALPLFVYRRRNQRRHLTQSLPASAGPADAGFPASGFFEPLTKPLLASLPDLAVSTVVVRLARRAGLSFVSGS
jgi:hypothetical protein